MYATHAKAIASYGTASPTNMAHVVTFVLCTNPGQPFPQIPAQMQQVDEMGADASCLFGSKRAGFLFTQGHKAELFREFHRIRREDTPDRRERLIELFLQVPGLGITKAAFVLQCLGEQTACLDTHNLKRLGLAEGAFTLGTKLKAATVRAKIRTYLAACDAVCGTAEWWDSWCERVGAKYGHSADYVSALHCDCLSIPAS